METINKELIEIIAKSLSQQASEAEENKLLKWRSDSDENELLFQEYKIVWSYKPKDESKLTFDKQEAWNKINTQLKQQENSETDVSRKRFIARPFSWIAAAAAIILLFFAINWFINQGNTVMLEQRAALNSASQFELPDHSIIDLYRGSAIRYPENFTAERKVFLDGSAYFDVTHQENNPFVIQIGELSVKVLGTSFFIDQQPGYVEVSVLSGKVVFYQTTESQHKVELEAGQQGHFSFDNKQFAIDDISSKNFLAWKSGKLVFEDAPLALVFSDLEKTFPITINNQADIDKLKLTATFENEIPADIFTTIEMLFSLDIEQNDTLFIIK